MSEKARKKVRMALEDAKEKLKHCKSETHDHSYYSGMAAAFTWVLMEV